MLAEQTLEKRYTTVIPELNQDFEQAVYWWYNEAREYRGIPDVVDLLEDHPYLNNVLDVVVRSEAMEFGGLGLEDEIPEGIFEGISSNLSENYDVTILHLLRDIQNYLNINNYMYQETDFFLLDVKNPDRRRDREFEIHNSSLVEVW